MQNFFSSWTANSNKILVPGHRTLGDHVLAEGYPNESCAGGRAYSVFITGATGLVGLHLVKHLGDRGHSVVAMVRSCSDSSALFDYIASSQADVRVVTADLNDQLRLKSYMNRCDVVVHTAACIDPHGNPQSLSRINVEGTRCALRAAVAAGVKQFIHISSLSVIMGEGDCYDITENEPLRPSREAYANSKVAAEQLVTDPRVMKAINVTTLRPGFIYGPSEKAWLPKLIYNMRARTALMVGDGSKETNLIYVENLCRAIELSLMNPVAFGQIYNLTDGELVTKRQLFDVICDQLNIPRMRIAIPLFLARLLVDASTAIASIAPARLKGRLAVFSRPALRLVGLNQGFDISKAERDLGYKQIVSFKEGMRRTLRSFGATESNDVEKHVLHAGVQD